MRRATGTIRSVRDRPLVLQGGGTLGAYQAGVYEALREAGIHPNWIAGMSIGAINAAIIAGNAPNDRVDRLREFWTQATSDGPWPSAGNACLDFARGDAMRQLLNQMRARVLRWQVVSGDSSRRARCALVSASRNNRSYQRLRHKRTQAYAWSA
jgi:NTE family protein